MIPSKRHLFIREKFEIPQRIMPRGIIGPRSIVRKGPVKEGEIPSSHFFNKFPIWPKGGRITISSYKSLPKTISLSNPFAKGRFGIPIRAVTIPTQKITYHKSSSKAVTSTNIASDSDSGLIGAGIGAILSILSFLI